jgi:hypothetical protein
MGLIICGGLGFTVIESLLYRRYYIKSGRKVLPLQTKVVLTTTVFLIISGTLLFWILDAHHSLDNDPFFNKGFHALFQSVTSRTAGFNTVDLGKASALGVILLTILMFIGGSPGSTAGGIKTTTAAIIFATVPRPTPGEKQRRMMLEGRIATILYETVGRPALSGEITGLSIITSKEGKPEFLISFKNTGSVHLRTRGEIIIRDKAGKEIGKAPLPDLPILPRSDRDFKVAWEAKLPAGEYVAELLMDIGRKELLAGERKFSISE